MAYTAPYIDETGLHLPTYEEILEELNNRTKQIYGQDLYLDVDSLDYQHNSVFSMFSSDCLSFVENIYQMFSPKYAVGTTLDNLVKLNGLKRKKASYSTVTLQLKGNIGTTIHNGIVSDSNNIRWILDEDTIIFTEETKIVSATCEKIGAIEAPVNSIKNIITPTRGWLSCTNLERATTGNPIETDSELRIRRDNSTEIASVNMIGSLYSALLALDNVKTCQVYENDTNVTDSNGIPAHSVACIVEGGNISEIGDVIFQKKGPGCGTYGDVMSTISQITGLTSNVYFFRPTEVTVNLEIPIVPSTFFTNETKTKIIQTIEDFFANIKIGMDITRGSIISVISKIIDDVYNPEFRVNLPIKTSKDDEALADSDTTIAFNEKAVLGELTLTGV